MRRLSWVHAGLVLALALSSSGCARFIRGSAGFAMGSAGRPGGAVDLDVGYGMGRERGAIGVDLSGRARVHGELGSGSVGAGLWGAVNRGRLLLLANGGISLLQLDSIRGTLYVNALSPRLNFGIGVNLSRSIGGNESGQITGMPADLNTVALTLNVSAEYNVRFALPGESLFSVMLGLAFMRAVSEDVYPPPPPSPPPVEPPPPVAPAEPSAQAEADVAAADAAATP